MPRMSADNPFLLIEVKGLKYFFQSFNSTRQSEHSFQGTTFAKAGDRSSQAISNLMSRSTKMTAGKLYLTGIFALLLALGASGTASARAFNIGPGLVPYPTYYYPAPAVPVFYPQPVYYPTVYPVYPAGPAFSFGFTSR